MRIIWNYNYVVFSFLCLPSNNNKDNELFCFSHLFRKKKKWRDQFDYYSNLKWKGGYHIYDDDEVRAHEDVSEAYEILNPINIQTNKKSQKNLQNCFSKPIYITLFTYLFFTQVQARKAYYVRRREVQEWQTRHVPRQKRRAWHVWTKKVEMIY